MKKQNKNLPGSRAVLYARVSTEEQAGKDHFSIDAQFNEMREFASEKGWEIGHCSEPTDESTPKTGILK